MRISKDDATRFVMAASRDRSTRSGGYEYEFVDDPVPARFQCNICTKVLREARLTECCGQHFCDSCLTAWLDRKKTCPHCRKEYFKSMVNKEKIREIDELRIRCTNRSKGCDWIGELGALKDHLESDKGCGYVMVVCNNSGGKCQSGLSKASQSNACWKRMERRYLARHMESECKYRPYTCEYCGYKDTYKGIIIGYKIFYKYGKETGCPSHYSTCNHYPLECTNKCGKKNIKRKDMKTHCDSCPLEPLDCPFKDAGCSKKIQRKDMEKHIESSMQEHLKIMFKSHQELKRRVEVLEGNKTYGEAGSTAQLLSEERYPSFSRPLPRPLPSSFPSLSSSHSLPDAL